MKHSRKRRIGYHIFLSIVIILALLSAAAVSYLKLVVNRESPLPCFSGGETGSGEESVLSETNGGYTVTEVTEVTEETERAEEVQEPEPQTPEITLMMIGDMLMHTRVIDSGLTEDGTYNYDHLFANIADSIAEADLAIVNQETIFGGDDKEFTGYPTFNSPTALGDAEAAAGFDVILHATNHALDKNSAGVLNCISFWENSHPEIAYLGINSSQEQRDEIYVYEQDGIRIAVLNYTYGTNGISVPSDMPYLVNYLEKDKVVSDLAKANEVADFVVVCPHWGTEYKLTPDDSQESWTKLFLENGVDLVIGTHPHVLEPVEWVTDDEGHRMLVYYSLGNFVNGTSSTEEDVVQRLVGGMAKVTIGMDETGNVVIKDYDAVPLVCHIAKGTDYTVYYLSDYTEELASENLISQQISGFSLEKCREAADKVWGSQDSGE